MPFKSAAQRGYLHAHPEILGKKGLAEWDAASKGQHVPEHTMKKHDFSHSVVEHHDDGSKTVHHIHKKHGHVHDTPKRDGDVKGSAGDHDQMIDHMMDHTSMPNSGEGKDEANQPMGAAGPVAPAAGAPPAGV